MQIYWNKRKCLHKKELNSHRTGLEHQYGHLFIVFIVFFFLMASVTSYENALYKANYHTIQYNSIQYSKIQCNTLPYNAMLYNTIHSLRSADVFPVVSSLPPKGGRKGYTIQSITMKYKTRQDKARQDKIRCMR